MDVSYLINCRFLLWAHIFSLPWNSCSLQSLLPKHSQPNRYQWIDGYVLISFRLSPNLLNPDPKSRPFFLSFSTVEDPSETFEDMRDKCDLYTLISGGDLKGLKLVPTIDRNLTEQIRKKYKLADVSPPSLLSPLPYIFKLSTIWPCFIDLEDFSVNSIDW